MGEFQRMTGQALGQNVSLVIGVPVPLKFIPARGEPLPSAFPITPAGVAAVGDINNRATANFSTFTLRGTSAGRATLTATGGGRTLAGPVAITVAGQIALPNALTNQGLLARLLLAEVPSPASVPGTTAQYARAMTLMRVVVENRLATPSVEWGSAGATTMTDVVRSPNQFHGFQDYPTLAGDVQARIDDMLRIANNAGDSRQPRLREHVEQALRIAAGPRAADPTGGHLFWWRTAAQGAPSSRVVVYETLLGNTFFRN